MLKITTLCLALTMSTYTVAVTVTVSASSASCGICNGSALATADGGLPPYTFGWSPEPASGQGTPNISGLCAGTWTVVVTDGLGNTAQADVVITSSSTLNPVAMNELRGACDGDCSGWGYIQQSSLGGTAPYTFNFPEPLVIPDLVGAGSIAFVGVCPGPNTIAVTDANGCMGTIEGYIMDGNSGPPQVLGTAPACGSEANGAIIMSGAGAFGYAAFMVYVDNEEVIYVFNTDGPYTLDGLAPGTYEVYYWNEFGSGLPGLDTPGIMYCTSAAQATVGSLTGPCGSISGRVYHDANEDCAFNGFDLGLPYRVLSIGPSQFVITDGTGNYQRNLDFGTYTIAQGVSTDEDPLCPATGSASITLDVATPAMISDFANLSSVPHDLSVSITGISARPGFNTQVSFNVTNNSAFPSGSLSIVLSYDNILLNPSSSTWNLPVLAPYSSQLFQFTASVPADIGLLGTNLSYGVAVTNSVGEVNTANNSAFLDVTITGSYDPNDKQGLTSSRSSVDQYFIDQDEHIDYTVRFQNTGTATAETVVIRDELDTDLDITSLQILGASHDFVPSFGEGRELVFTFNDIGLPDSTTDQLGSQGHISYRIKPNEGIVIGDVLENTAGIYFDFNPPIITNTVVHEVDFSTSVQDDVVDTWSMTVSPNPTRDVLNVNVPNGLSSGCQLLSIDGRRIDVPRMISSGSIQMNVRALEPGTYVIRTVEGSARFVKD
jgi:uncharacterized repeat protein (TIGR01451 family)